MWELGEVGGATVLEIERHAATVLGLTGGELRTFVEDVWTEYLGTLNRDLARYFASLRPRYRTGILSNSFVGAREREQAAYGFADLCDIIVYSHEEGVRKPDAAVYQIICDRLAVRPQEALFLDDSPTCVEGARRVGMDAILFTDTASALAELERRLDTGAAGPASRGGRGAW